MAHWIVNMLSKVSLCQSDILCTYEKAFDQNCIFCDMIIACTNITCVDFYKFKVIDLKEKLRKLYV